MPLIINSFKMALKIILTMLFLIVLLAFFVGFADGVSADEQADKELNLNIACNIYLENGTFDHLGAIKVSKASQGHYVGSINVLINSYSFTILEVPEVYTKVEQELKLRGFAVSEQECKEALERATSLRLSTYQSALYKGMIPSIKLTRDLSQIQGL